MSSDLPDDDSRIEEELLDRPIASMRDLQYLYGSLNILSQGASGEYAAYLTPAEAEDLLGEPDSVVVVRVDVSGESPVYEGVHLDTYREELTPLVAHSKYSASRGVDHSITHISGQGNEPEKLATYATERLTSWPTKEAVQSVAESHDDGYILSALAELGNDESVVEEIQTDVESRLEGSRQALLTVQVRVQEDSEWKWPGELDVFGAAMAAQKTHKMSTKGKASDSRGTASDMVTGEDGPVVGTADDPLSFYLTKQASAFPNLNPEESWRNHPISRDTALRVGQSEPYLEKCASRAYRATVYTLPYFAEMTVQRARLLQELFDALDEDDGEKGPLQYIYEHAREVGVEDDLRFAVVALIQEQASLVTLLGHDMTASGFVPADLAATHEAILEGPLFAGDDSAFDWFDGENDDGYAKYPLAYPWHEHSDTAASARLFADIARGRYFLRTFSDIDFQSDASPTDAHVRAFMASFGSDPFPVTELLEEYVQRIIEEEDPGSFFPDQTVTQQFAQLLALADTGLLAGDSDLTTASADTMTNPSSDSDPDASNAERREQALNEFIETHEPLANPERRAIFLLGALIGHVDRYQRGSENRSKTVLSMHPVKSMTKASLKRALSDALDKTIAYSHESDHINSGLMYSEITSRLPEEFENDNPADWDISLDDLRFHYAMGITYAHGSGRTAQND